MAGAARRKPATQTVALLTDQNGMLTATLRRLARIARARGVETCAIDDVVQESLLEAWGHLDRLAATAQGFHAWIDEICRNVCRRYDRTRQTNLLRHVSLPQVLQYRTMASLSDSDKEELSPFTNIPDPDLPDPFKTLQQTGASVVLLDHALGHVLQETRQIVEMCHLLKFPHGEVAERLRECIVEDLQTRLHRARRHLRQILRGPLHHESASFGLGSGTGR